MRSSRAVPLRALTVLGVALVAVVLVAGISPGATKFLTKKKALKLFPKKADVHTKTEADAAFVNVNETAANANLLDGQDSSAFLGSNAKAADADLLDGQNSTAFMAGPGKVIEEAVAFPPGASGGIMLEDGFLNIQYQCPDVLSDNGAVGFLNLTNGTVNLFVDNGSTNPTYQQVAPGPLSLHTANAAGEFLTFQVHAPNVGMATIHVMSVHRASDCFIQAQAVISN